MSTIVDPSLVTDSVVELLGLFLPVPVGDGEAPLLEDDDGNVSFVPFESGYAVVYAIPSGARFEGSELAGTEAAMGWFRFQVSTVGIQRNQVEAIASKAASIFLDRDDSGAFVNAMSVPAHTVMDRRHAGFVPFDQAGSAMAGVLIDVMVHRNADA